VLNRALIQRATFTFALGIVFFCAGNSVTGGIAFAQFRPQHTAPAILPPLTTTKLAPSAPLVESPAKQDAAVTKADQSVRDQIIEHHSEQLKSNPHCVHRLEQRRHALLQQRGGGYRNPRSN
jgi:hypothetical protein